MEWFEDLYDDFRQRTGFGSIPVERTRREVDFITQELLLRAGDRALDLCSGMGRHCIELERRGIRAAEEREFDMSGSRVRSQITHHEGASIVRRSTDWRLYSLHELKAIGKEAGLMLLAAYGDLERNPADLETRLMKLVFEAQEETHVQHCKRREI